MPVTTGVRKYRAKLLVCFETADRARQAADALLEHVGKDRIDEYHMEVFDHPLGEDRWKKLTSDLDNISNLQHLSPKKIAVEIVGSIERGGGLVFAELPLDIFREAEAFLKKKMGATELASYPNSVPEALGPTELASSSIPAR